MREDTSEVSLPSKPQVEQQDMRKLYWIVYGPPGVGKSTFLSSAKDVFFLTTDSGHKFINSMHRPIKDWPMFKKYVKMIVAEQPDYTAICLDNIDGIAKMCRKYVCEKRGIEHQSDEKWGKAFDMVASEFETELMKLTYLQKYGLFFISHSSTRDIKTTFSEKTFTGPTLPNQFYKILSPIADIVAYMGLDDKADEDGVRIRRMYFQPTENMEAKDRTTCLPESIKIPKGTNGFELVEKYLEEPKSPPKKKKIILKRK
jgi:AAA15 family ATPase/GTPase